MHIDLRKAKPAELRADVAIVGSGASGQTVARALVQGGCSVVLLESGGVDFEPATADLNHGRTVGQHYYPLKDARLRLFGGTTAIWGGRNAQLDPVDFLARSWVPWSGWPFDSAALEPYYERAWKLFDMPAAPDAAHVPPVVSRLEGPDIVAKFWRIDRQGERFQLARNRDLLLDPAVTVVTHATVREIVPGQGRAISHLKVIGPGGHVLLVRAANYVIAAGGIENARLLLASNSVQPAGLGNGNGLVGRFFMEHPHGRGGRITGAAAWPLLRAFQKRSAKGHDVAWLLTASAQAQSRLGLLNGAMTIAVRPPAQGRRSLFAQAYHVAKHRIAPTRQGRSLWQAYKRLGRVARRRIPPIHRWLRYRTGKEELTIVLRAEQSPNPDSRLRLISETDRTGMPRVELDWRLQRQDRESAAGLVRLLGEVMHTHGLGRVELARWLSEAEQMWLSDPLVSAHPIGGFHHMGTTRMASNPRHGVTDEWGRVHGVENLYIAGSSLFPTGGWANPTLTIVALSMRTADRILLRQSRRGRRKGA